nr:hypothetical protein [Granulosicoccus sp.]
RVVDDTTQQSWHPQLTAVDLTETASVVTVSSPSTNYQADTAFDMEAAGFLTAATRYSTLEFIQCLKIVSDNSRNPLETLDKGKVTQLISDQVPNIVQVIEGLLNLHQTIPDNSVIMQLIADCKKTMKISATQESTLLRLLQRFEVIEHRLPTCQELNQQPNTKALLTKLASTLDNRSGKY